MQAYKVHNLEEYKHNLMHIFKEEQEELKGNARELAEQRSIRSAGERLKVVYRLSGVNEEEETKKFIAEMEEDIIPIDGLIAFAESDAGAKVFGGPEKAKGAAEHGREIKAAGAKYCDCPACAAVEAILSKKGELLG